MRFHITIICCFIVHLACAQHVVLVSIDGLRPEMYSGGESWQMPTLHRLVKEGVYARYMTSVFPAYTYPAHTAMLTGALPARSGIYFNQPKGSKGEWNWFTAAIKVPTLWQALKKAGLTTAAVEWPVSVDSNITYNIPEIWDTAHLDDRITKARQYATPGLVEEIEANATGRLDSSNMTEENFSLDAHSAVMAGYILKKYKPNFLAVHFAEVDGLQHAYGREGDSVRLAVAEVDRCVGAVLQAIRQSGLQDSTTVIIVGDHGFCTMHTLFRLNQLIQGLPARFTTTGGSAFLYGDPAAAQKVVAILNKLPEDQRRLFRILDRRKLDQMGADSSALLAVAAVPGVVFSGSMNGSSLQEISGGHHGYDPRLPDMHTGFIAYGSGIQKGVVIKELCITDMAPLIAKLLGVEFPVPDGKLVPGIIKEHN